MELLAEPVEAQDRDFLAVAGPEDPEAGSAIRTLRPALHRELQTCRGGKVSEAQPAACTLVDVMQPAEN